MKRLKGPEAAEINGQRRAAHSSISMGPIAEIDKVASR
jgi:hypothetical protein